MIPVPAGRRQCGPLHRTCWGAAIWASFYGVYRLYYAAGGTVGMLGTPASLEQWRFINAVAAILLFVAAALPLALRRLWNTHHGKRALLVLCWLITVACVTHALIGVVQRLSSRAGWLTISYPFWNTIDSQRADLQALFFNEPWFLVEGLLWGAMAWLGALRGSSGRWRWIGSALLAILALTAIGLLSAFGVIGKLIIG
jgi:hypothetical protein